MDAEDTRAAAIERVGVDGRSRLQAQYAAYLVELAESVDGVEVGRELEAEFFQGREDLHAFALLADGAAVGFALVLSGGYARVYDPEAEHHLLEFYVAPAHRGGGLARRAAELVFAGMPGAWSLDVGERNARARAFWRRVLTPRGARETAGGAEPGCLRWRFRVG